MGGERYVNGLDGGNDFMNAYLSSNPLSCRY